MPGHLTVRKCRVSDLDRILEIERASFGKEAYDRNLFAELWHGRGALFLVGESGRKLCGYIVTCIRGERAELVSIAVAPAARECGAASALLDSTLRRLKRRGAVRFVLMVRPDNIPALAFYAKYGFRRVRTVRHYYEDGANGLLMTRELS